MGQKSSDDVPDKREMAVQEVTEHLKERYEKHFKRKSVFLALAFGKKVNFFVWLPGNLKVTQEDEEDEQSSRKEEDDEQADFRLYGLNDGTIYDVELESDKEAFQKVLEVIKEEGALEKSGSLVSCGSTGGIEQ